jgi:hypothetical protein
MLTMACLMDNSLMHHHKKRHIICSRHIMIKNDMSLESVASLIYFTIFNYCFGTNIYGDMIFLILYHTISQ